MLSLDFDIQIRDNCRELIFTETTGTYSATNPGGYGTPNIPVGNIVETKLIIIFPNKKKYILNSTFLPTQIQWLIDANEISDLQYIASSYYNPNVKYNCGCIPPSDIISVIPFTFPYEGSYTNCNPEKPNMLNYFYDGCYEFTYEVYATTGLPVLKCDYLLTHKIWSGQRMFVRKNGGYYDVTDEGVISGNNFTWSKSQTTDSYTSWELRGSDGNIVDFGTLEKYSCVVDTYSETSDEPQLVAAKTYIIPLTAVVDKKMSDLAYNLVIEDPCTNTLRAGVSKSDSYNLFALARAKLLAIKNNPTCGCDCVADTVSTLNDIIDSITQTTTGSYAC